MYYLDGLSLIMVKIRRYLDVFSAYSTFLAKRPLFCAYNTFLKWNARIRHSGRAAVSSCELFCAQKLARDDQRRFLALTVYSGNLANSRQTASWVWEPLSRWGPGGGLHRGTPPRSLKLAQTELSRVTTYMRMMGAGPHRPPNYTAPPRSIFIY